MTRNREDDGAVEWTMRRDAQLVGPVPGQVRSPWKEWLLAVVTLGVYAAIRHHRVNRELSDFGVEVDPDRALLAFFPGAVLGVPFLVTVHRTGQRILVAQETAGLTPSIVPWRSTVLSVLAFAHVPSEQTALNEVWRADSGGSTEPISAAHVDDSRRPSPTQRGISHEPDDR